jgi:hypothetical protein
MTGWPYCIRCKRGIEALWDLGVACGEHGRAGPSWELSKRPRVAPSEDLGCHKISDKEPRESG